MELAEADRLLRERKLRELMLAGVTIEKPETVTIDADVTIGMDTVVEPFAQILGTDRRSARTAASAPARSCATRDSATRWRSSRSRWWTRRGWIARRHAGPFARLRMDNHVEEGAHVGNFVELKKTRLGAGAKAMHLAYLGDSQIGRAVEYRRRHHHLQLRRLRETPDRRSAKARSSAAIRRWWRPSRSARALTWRPAR